MVFRRRGVENLVHNFFPKINKGQVTIFIILAIVIVSLVALFFVLRGSFGGGGVPSEVSPIYTSFTYCLEDNMKLGIEVLEGHGGYIYLPELEKGSSYMPFSSQLSFLGNNIPYWYYVSGNNFEKEQIPTKSEMESQLEKFMESRINNCNLDSFYDEGFVVSFGEPDASVKIQNNKVVLDLDMDLSIIKEDSTQISNHEISIDSDLGLLYNDAIKVYEEEKNSLFLENYTLDILNLYAPVDGVEFSCSPKVWNSYNVLFDLQEAVQENLGVVSVEGENNDYFVLENLKRDISDDVHVDFLYFPSWPYTFEVNPSEGPLLVANPVGNEMGLGALGFCYVTYHFVYDFKYPVIVQLYNKDTSEIFQFPLAVVIEGSNPRKALAGELSLLESPDICSNSNTEFQIKTLDSNSNQVDSYISFECFSQTCYIGNAENGILSGLFPQCVNGYVIAKADGFENSQIQTSTVNSGSLTIFMDKLYEKEIYLKLDSSYYSGEALVIFENSNGNSKTILYPSQKKINISAGTYDISVSIYKNVSLEMGSTTQEYCTDVPRRILGVFGLTRKECQEIEVPEQLLSRALAGGGTSVYTFSENDLRSNNRIAINSEKFPNPDSLVQIQENYILFENKNLGVILE